MSGVKKHRGTPIALPSWWMEEVRTRFDKEKRDKTTNKVRLAVALSDAVGRDPKWDHKAFELFLAGEVVTLEMYEAFMKLWSSLPQPIFVAPSHADANRMIELVRR